MQRRLRLGYTRAARIMDELENRGIVGPSKGAEPRDILIDLDGGGSGRGSCDHFCGVGLRTADCKLHIGAAGGLDAHPEFQGVYRLKSPIALIGDGRTVAQPKLPSPYREKDDYEQSIRSGAFLVVGVILIVFGVSAADSFASNFKPFFTGSPTDKSMWLLIGGIITSGIGLLSFVWFTKGLAAVQLSVRSLVTIETTKVLWNT